MRWTQNTNTINFNFVAISTLPREVLFRSALTVSSYAGLNGTHLFFFRADASESSCFVSFQTNCCTGPYPLLVQYIYMYIYQFSITRYFRTLFLPKQSVDLHLDPDELEKGNLKEESPF